MIREDVLNKLLEEVPQNAEISYACIGTNEDIGDSIGPFVGSILSSKGFQVYGTINKPMHASTMQDFIDEIENDNSDYIISIDACLASPDNNLYDIKARSGGIKPGSAVGRNFPEIGDIGIIAVTIENIYFKKCNLGKVIALATDIADTIIEFEKIRFRNTIGGYYESN